MIEKLTVNSFKSLESVEVDLGQVNVFIGANGSGKSNLLEALGVLSAAADGKVNDQTLLQRGVRPGVPALYKSAFSTRIPPHIFFAAANSQLRYEVSLHNPLKDPSPVWRFRTERWQEGARSSSERSPAMKSRPNPEQGLAAQGRRVRTRFAGPRVIETFAGICHLSSRRRPCCAALHRSRNRGNPWGCPGGNFR